MKITPDQVRELAKSARLSLTDAECKVFGDDMDELEHLCAPLLTLSGAFVESDQARDSAFWRADVVGECLPREEIERLASVWEDGYIPVPRAVEGGDS